MGTATAESAREALAFRQRRVALFGLASGGLGFIFLLFRSVIAVSEREYREFIDPSFLYHLLAVAAGVCAWLSCRSDVRSGRVVQTAEALALVGVSVAYQLMGWYLPLAARPETIVLLALTYSFMAWAAFVPSPPRRTLLLSLAVGVPLVVGTYVVYLGADETLLRGATILKTPPTAAQFAGRFAMAHPLQTGRPFRRAEGRRFRAGEGPERRRGRADRHREPHGNPSVHLSGSDHRAERDGRSRRRGRTEHRTVTRIEPLPGRSTGT